MNFRDQNETAPDSKDNLEDAFHTAVEMAVSDYGQPEEIIRLFGGPEKLAQAVKDLQAILYAS